MLNYEIIEFIRDKTGGLLKENSSEYQVFCPFCDDAYRKPNPRWGHLYISKEKPVFFCHRCNARGHIIKLLEYLEYPDIDRLKKLFKISKQLNIHLPINNIKTSNTKNEVIIDINKLKQYKIEKNSLALNYISRRTKLSDLELIFKLNLLPIVNKITKQPAILITGQELITNDNSIYPYQIRLINQKKYTKLISSESNISIPIYPIIDPLIIYEKQSQIRNRMLRIDTINLSEGIFDIVNIYTHIYKLTDNYNQLFISITGSYYQKVIIQLLKQFPLLKTVNIYLDADINIERLIRMIRYSIKSVQNLINDKFQINFYKNLFGKDFGDLSKTNLLAPVLIKTMEVY